MPITNALIGAWSQTSVWLALHKIIDPQCNILPVSSPVKCECQLLQVLSKLKITWMFKLLFGLEEYTTTATEYRTTTASWRWMKMVNKVCQVTGRRICCTPWPLMSMGLAVSLIRSHPSSLVTLQCATVQCYLWHRGMWLLATGQVDWDHCIAIKLLVYL